jgi:hypothetical protein
MSLNSPIANHRLSLAERQTQKEKFSGATDSTPPRKSFPGSALLHLYRVTLVSVKQHSERALDVSN